MPFREHGGEIEMIKPTRRQMQILRIMLDGRAHSQKDLRAKFDTLQEMCIHGWIEGFLKLGCSGVKPEERLFRIEDAGAGFVFLK